MKSTDRSNYYKVLLCISLSLVTYTTWANNRIIIKFKPDSTQTRLNGEQLKEQLIRPLSIDKLQLLSKISGEELQDVGPIATGGRVIATNHDLNNKEMEGLLHKLNNMPKVAYAEEDKIVPPTNGLYAEEDKIVPPTNNLYAEEVKVVSPTNNLNPLQWYMNDITKVIGNIYYGNSFISKGQFVKSKGEGITIAVVDTGYVPHPNFLSNLVGSPSDGYGYNFISDCREDATCPISTPDSQAMIKPKPDALDNGDWVTQQEYDQAPATFKSACRYLDEPPYFFPTASTWHGTHLIGTIIGQGYDKSSKNGILGGAYKAKVLPVRVVGKCGGYLSDKVNGMLWSVNAYPGIENPNPAQVVNISTGGRGKCPASEQDAINTINQRGSIVVVAVGDEGIDVKYSQPENCKNVISVAAADPNKSLASYSNYGDVTITASGGDSYYPKEGTKTSMVVSTFYKSKKSYKDCQGKSCFNYAYKEGASMASSIVSAAVADLLSINRSFTYNDIKQLLQDTADDLTYNCFDENECVPLRSFLNVSKAEEAAIKRSYGK